jgi:hypothetical protein
MREHTRTRKKHGSIQYRGCGDPHLLCLDCILSFCVVHDRVDPSSFVFAEDGEERQGDRALEQKLNQRISASFSAVFVAEYRNHGDRPLESQ